MGVVTRRGRHLGDFDGFTWCCCIHHPNLSVPSLDVCRWRR
jgi:hypothetical protein